MEGNHYRARLNGVWVIDFTDPTPKSFDGGIALQLHSGGQGNMRFKDICRPRPEPALSRMRRRLWYCDHHGSCCPPGHKFPMRKYRLLRELLAADGRFVFEPAPVASMRRSSSSRTIRTTCANSSNGTLDPQAMRRIGFPWSESLVRRTLASVGGTLAAAGTRSHTGFGGNLAGGTHHAFRGEGSGFCVFNDIAVAILALRRDELAARAAVIDLDVHQGDGTAHIFERRSRRVHALHPRRE